MAGHFEVVFNGEVYASVYPSKAQADMAKLFKQPLEKVKPLFNGEPWVLKDHLDREQAERYQVELAKIGIITELRDRTPEEEEKKTDPHAQSQDLTLETIGIAHMTCPDCGYEQLDADFCAKCGVSIAYARAKANLKAKGDDEIQKRIQAMRRKQSGGAIADLDMPGDTAKVNVPSGMVQESTKEFERRQGGKSSNAALIWALATLLLAGGIAAAMAYGVISFSF